MDLRPHMKCLVDFVRDKCDVAGFWEPNWVLAQTYIDQSGKIKLSEADLLKIDRGQQFVKMPDGKIFCVGFIEFQYGQLSETCNPHKKIISILKKHGVYERVLQGYFKGTSTLEEEEEEQELDKEEEKGFGEAENLLPKGSGYHLFRHSIFSDFKTFSEHMTEQAEMGIDIRYYFEKVKDWSQSGNNKKADWIATTRNFIRGDGEKGKVKMIEGHSNKPFMNWNE